ncbi:hypothetical protein KSP40_PGU007551 [Platanthera guangdongensis]|uniref:Uncharacterized protein n=1 Tax=Platanthera guangdongensis TaxID=2320717 RepID=A0ABR2MX35_9ASPA
MAGEAARTAEGMTLGGHVGPVPPHLPVNILEAEPTSADIQGYGARLAREPESLNYRNCPEGFLEFISNRGTQGRSHTDCDEMKVLQGFL